jgi:hypothetical protein
MTAFFGCRHFLSAAGIWGENETRFADSAECNGNTSEGERAENAAQPAG